MKKAFSIIEIIMGIIFIGMLSEIIVGIAQVKKINIDSNININNHILLESEIEQMKGTCCYLNTTTCSIMGGVSSGNNMLAIGDTCTIDYNSGALTYYETDDNGNVLPTKPLDHMSPNEITATCTKISDGFFNIDVSLKTPKNTLKGNALVNACM